MTSDWPPLGVDWYYSDPYVAIACADCLEVLPVLPKVDLVLTDPPYGIGERMQGGTWGTAAKYEDFRQWDVAPDFETLRAVIAAAPCAIVWGGNNFSLPPSRCWLVWDKANAVPTMADCELAWTNLDRPTKRLRLPVGRHDTGHPTQKPLALMAWCLSLVPKAETILDPFAGSCTTARAVKDLSRRCICVEQEERYCEIGAQRCRQEVFDFDLPAEAK